MRIVDLAKEMGGVKRRLDKPLKPIYKADLAHLFDIDNPNFGDYIDFMTTFGGDTYFNILYNLRPYSESAEYTHPKESGIQNISFGGLDIGLFFGEGVDYDEKYQISYVLDNYKERIPNGYIPIAYDSFGNLTLMSVVGDKKGYIYFWDGHNDPDADEYFEDYGIIMKEEVKMQNMYCVGTNLYDCFKRMIIDPDAYN